MVGVFDQYVDLIEANPIQRDILLQAAGVSAIYDAEGNRLQLERPAARAWIVESACWHTDEESLLTALLDPEWNPLTQVHLLGEGDCPSAPLVDDAPGEVISISNQGNSRVVDVNLTRPFWLVMADTYYPGWYAGGRGSESYTIYRANFAFRAVQLPAGDQTIFVTYEPRWFWIGPIISVISLFILVVLFRSKSLAANQ